ncbi:ATP-binding cassette domain-containing protein [Clostridium sp. CX1]|uniref:ATP-binding cassette domain-containing protein n=1 Tax=Clostridium tanneri TaxID=3037988 RepID=A0ABU4JVW8_9CLOT|nr:MULTISPECIES: ATP-binding cassette domain-containing protein [unclassified Clostridium]MCT8977116.1 ATP-binding cassette domain-containing protein [Clostridium sp. CX1]MDW8802294.1 ATP-binding cassette domain-containing protein [Clostridium sp. A1-XYC3]
MQVHIKGAFKEYDGRKVLGIDELSFLGGKVYVVLGLNGSGKSTLLNCIAGINTLDRGSILYNGESRINSIRKNISIVTQSPYLFNSTVLENIISGLKYRKINKEDIHFRVKKYMNYFHIDKLFSKNVRNISGGEAAKTAIIRAAVLETELSILDEPTAAMDVESTLEAEKLIKDMTSNNRTVIMVTHDMYQAERIADYVIFMDKGKVIESGSKTKVFKNPEHPLVKTVLNRGN